MQALVLDILMTRLMHGFIPPAEEGTPTSSAGQCTSASQQLMQLKQRGTGSKGEPQAAAGSGGGPHAAAGSGGSTSEMMGSETLSEEPHSAYPSIAQLCTLLESQLRGEGASSGLVGGPAGNHLGEDRESGLEGACREVQRAQVEEVVAARGPTGEHEKVAVGDAQRFCEALACLETATAMLPRPSGTNLSAALSAPQSVPSTPSAPSPSSGMLLPRHLASGDVRLMCLVAVQRALSGTLPVWPGVGGGGGREQPVSPPQTAADVSPPLGESSLDTAAAGSAGSADEGEEGEEGSEGGGGQRILRRNHRGRKSGTVLPGAAPFGKLRPRQGGGGSRGGQVRRGGGEGQKGVQPK